jgi:hypothetical protein
MHLDVAFLPDVIRLPSKAKRRTFVSELLAFALDPKIMGFFSLQTKRSDPVPE